MISSAPLSVALTVLFAATSAYALLRWAALRAGVARYSGDQVAELSHLVMSLAMVAMVWTPSGPAGTWFQVVVYLAFGGYFAGHLRLRRPAEITSARHHCPSAPYHLLMVAAMIWMVASMPLLMSGGATTAPGMTGMAGMPGMAGMAGPAGEHGGHGGQMADAAGSTPGWVLAVTAVVVLALLAAALFWIRRIARPPAAHPVTIGGPGTVAVLPRQASVGRLASSLTPRSEAVCHLGMSVGMAAMLVAMV